MEEPGINEDLGHFALIRIPFTLHYDDLHLEAPSSLGGIANEDWNYVGDEFSPEELDRLFRSYTIARVCRPEWTLGQCFRTAIVWERG